METMLKEHPNMGAKLPPSGDLRLSAGVLCTFTKMEAGEGKPAKRRFSMLAHTGSPIETWFGRMIVDLDGMKIGRTKKPILLNHSTDKIVGHSDTIEKGNDGLTIDGVMLASTEDLFRVAATADEGFPWQASIGFNVSRWEEIKAGDSVEVNGIEFAGPGYVARKSELLESSFVPLGADGNTSSEVLHRAGQTVTEVIMADKEKTETISKDELAAAKAESEKVGAKASADRLQELSKAFPDRPQFVIEQFGKGNDVLKAKAELADVLTVELATAKADAAKKTEASDGHKGVGVGSAPTQTQRSAVNAPPSVEYGRKFSAKEAEFDSGIAAQADKKWETNHNDCQKKYPSRDSFVRSERMRACAAVGPLGADGW